MNMNYIYSIIKQSQLNQMADGLHCKYPSSRPSEEVEKLLLDIKEAWVEAGMLEPTF